MNHIGNAVTRITINCIMQITDPVERERARVMAFDKGIIDQSQFDALKTA